MYRAKLEEYLTRLHASLIEMCNLVDINISKSIKMLTTDADLVDLILENERQVNEYEKEIEALCLKIILKQQPVAIDLRTVSTALKIITDLERISDQTLDMAKLINKIDTSKNNVALEMLNEMSQLSKTMVKDSTMCFVKNEYENASKIIKKDKEINEYLRKIKLEVINEIKKDTNNIDDLVNILLVAKYLEKISDHAKNICEWTIFCNTGVHKDVEIL